MSIEKFNHLKDRFANTKPIRGRTVECRPIANRSRDWEQVVKGWVVEQGALDMEGNEAYGVRLYQTDCVMYMPNGDVHVKSGGWATPTTAEFINRYLPRSMSCYKKYNKIWVDYASQAYPIDTQKPTIFRFNKDTDSYTIENPMPMLQKVVDRTKSKDARKPVEAFRAFCKVMLKMSDGWVSNDLIEANMDKGSRRDYWGRAGYMIGDKIYTGYEMSGSISKSTAEAMYQAMSTQDDTQYPKLLCIIASASNALTSRVVKQEDITENDYNGNPRIRTVQTREYQYDYKTVDNRINHIIKQACDVYTTKEVPVGKIVTNLI